MHLKKVILEKHAKLGLFCPSPNSACFWGITFLGAFCH
jgi:hypothetical protein